MKLKKYLESSKINSIPAYAYRISIILATCSAQALTFSNATTSAGLDVAHEVSGFSILDVQPYMTGGAAAGDFDNDGFVDLYITRLKANDLLFRNRGDGTFQDVTSTSGISGTTSTNGAAWGDIDNDGDLDLYVTVIDDNRFKLYVNNGSGGFTEEAAVRGADVPITGNHSGFSVTFGDYDRDGWLDIHTTEWGENISSTEIRSALLRNQGAMNPGHFTDVTLSANARLAGDGVKLWSFTSRFSDFDGDGWPDLAVAADFGTSQLFWNNGDGTFTDGTTDAGLGTEENGMGSAIGDYDGDGRLDWFVTSIYDSVANRCVNVGEGSESNCDWGSTGNRLYRNIGDRKFSDQTDIAGVQNGEWGWGAAFFDYDNDGDLDLTMTNGIDFPQSRIDNDAGFDADQIRLWRNDGGTFSDVAGAMGITNTGSGKGLLTFDYDNDGDLDLFVINNNGQPVLYRNDGGNDNHWLRIKTKGKISNRDGIGAFITVEPTASGPEQVREVSAGSHYLAQSEFTAHFGLGQQTDPVKKITIRWPSGIVQVFDDTPVDTVITAVEPKFIFTAGWNLISLPMEPFQTDSDVLFGPHTTATIWKWDNNRHRDAGFAGVNQLESKVGYWVFFNNAVEIPLRGDAADKSMELKAGWNLIGVSETTLPERQKIIGKIWKWNSELNRFETTTADEKLVPGKGYWVYVKQDVTMF